MMRLTRRSQPLRAPTRRAVFLRQSTTEPVHAVAIAGDSTSSGRRGPRGAVAAATALRLDADHRMQDSLSRCRLPDRGTRLRHPGAIHRSVASRTPARRFPRSRRARPRRVRSVDGDCIGVNIGTKRCERVQRGFSAAYPPSNHDKPCAAPTRAAAGTTA